MAEQRQTTSSARFPVPVKSIVIGFVALLGWLMMGSSGPDFETRSRIDRAVRTATAGEAQVIGYGDNGRIVVVHTCPDGEKRRIWLWEALGSSDNAVRLLAPSPNADEQWLALPVPLDDDTRGRLRSLFGERPWCGL